MLATEEKKKKVLYQRQEKKLVSPETNLKATRAQRRQGNIILGRSQEKRNKEEDWVERSREQKIRPIQKIETLANRAANYEHQGTQRINRNNGNRALSLGRV